MSTEINNHLSTSSSPIYQVRFKGQLDTQWTGWFEGLTVTADDNGNTLLSGEIIDQAALFGLLKKIRNLGLPLLSVNQVKPIQGDANNLVPPFAEPPDKE